MNKYIVNTTFVVERGLEGAFVEWARGTMMVAARRSERFDGVKMMKILTETDPDAVNYAIQLMGDSREGMSAWINDVAVLILDDLRTRVGQNVLFFMTEMEVIE